MVRTYQPRPPSRESRASAPLAGGPVMRESAPVTREGEPEARCDAVESTTASSDTVGHEGPVYGPARRPYVEGVVAGIRTIGYRVNVSATGRLTYRPGWKGPVYASTLVPADPTVERGVRSLAARDGAAGAEYRATVTGIMAPGGLYPVTGILRGATAPELRRARIGEIPRKGFALVAARFRRLCRKAGKLDTLARKLETSGRTYSAPAISGREDAHDARTLARIVRHPGVKVALLAVLATYREAQRAR